MVAYFFRRHSLVPYVPEKKKIKLRSLILRKRKLFMRSLSRLWVFWVFLLLHKTIVSSVQILVHYLVIQFAEAFCILYKSLFISQRYIINYSYGNRSVVFLRVTSYSRIAIFFINTWDFYIQLRNHNCPRMTTTVGSIHFLEKEINLLL